MDFYQLCFCHAPDDFFKAHLEAPSWFNIEMTKSCRIQGESVHLLAYSVNSTCCAERLELTPEKPESLDQPQRCLDRLLRALGQPEWSEPVSVRPGPTSEWPEPGFERSEPPSKRPFRASESLGQP